VGTCSVCNEVIKQDEVIPALGHDYTDVVTPPTCTEKGYTTHTCTRGDDTKVDAYTDATDHSYTSKVTLPTCTEKGYTTYICIRCDATKVDNYTEFKGHSYTDVVTPPTCTEKGYTTHTCSVCGYSYKDGEKANLGHSYSAVVTPATCTEKGYTTHTCTRCGDSYKNSETAKLDHSYEVVKEVAATLLKKGSKTSKCKICGDEKTEDIPMLEGQAMTFKDVTGDWYAKAVAFVSSRKLMQGDGSGNFYPTNNLTRGEMVQILYNAAGKPAVTGSTPFKDVAAGKWYTAAVTWAYQQGLGKGTGDGFKIDRYITREELAIFLWRYAGKPTASKTKMATFSDASQVGTYADAQEAMRWATETGIIQGKPDGKIHPKDTATRSEAAQMLQRYIELS
jgi:hypothetical protein